MSETPVAKTPEVKPSIPVVAAKAPEIKTPVVQVTPAPVEKKPEITLTPEQKDAVSAAPPVTPVIPPAEKKIMPLMSETPADRKPPVSANPEAKVEVSKTEDKTTNEPFLVTKPVEAQQEIKTEEKTEEKVQEERQVTFEFEIKSRTINELAASVPTETEPPAQPVSEKTEAEKIQENEQRKKAQERILKLKELSFKLKTPTGISDLENEPAYKRRNVDLDSTPHSSESQVSRYTLSEGEDKKIEIKPNNSFLHDNVD